MTRLEYTEPSIEQLREEVSSLKKQGKKSGGMMKRFFSKLALLILGIFILFVAGAYAFARTGLGPVPYLSENFYSDPQPVRVVAPVNVADVNAHVAQAVTAYVKKGNAGDFSISLSEGELSALAQQVLITDVEEPHIDQIQVAIEEDHLEVFSHFVRPAVYLTVSVKPRIEEGRVRFDLSNFFVGQLPLPASLGGGLVRITAEPLLNRLLDSVGQYGELSRIDIGSGSVLLVAHRK